MKTVWNSQAFSLGEHRLLAHNSNGPDSVNHEQLQLGDKAEVKKELSLGENKEAAQQAGKDRVDRAQATVETNVQKLQKNLDATNAMGAVVDGGSQSLDGVKKAFIRVHEKANAAGNTLNSAGTNVVGNSPELDPDKLDALRAQLDAIFKNLNSATTIEQANSVVAGMNNLLATVSPAQVDDVVRNLAVSMNPMELQDGRVRLVYYKGVFGLQSVAPDAAPAPTPAPAPTVASAPSITPDTQVPGATFAPSEVQPAAPTPAAEEKPEDASEQIKKIDEQIASIDKDLNQTDPAPSEERKQELTLKKEALTAEKKALEAAPTAPQTNMDRLSKQMNEGFTEFENAQTNGEKWAAVMKILATIGEFIQEMKSGTLLKSTDVPAAADKPQETNGATALGEKLDGELKDRAEKNKETDPAKNREGLKQEKLEKITKNKQTLNTLDGDVERAKDNKKASLAEKFRIETAITNLGTDESKAAEVASLQRQLEMVTKQITAADEAINAIDKQRDELDKANKQLETEVAALEGREAGSGILEQVITRLNALLAKNGFPIKTSIEETGGKFFIVVEGLSLEQAKMIDPTATSGTVRIDALNLPAGLRRTYAESPSDKRADKPIENKDAQVSVNELQQRRERILNGQAEGLLGDKDLGISKKSGTSVQGGAEFGTEYSWSTNFLVRYDAPNKQWQIRPASQAGVPAQWQTPSQFVAPDAENAAAVQRLKNFNTELASLDAQILAAQKREQTA